MILLRCRLLVGAAWYPDQDAFFPFTLGCPMLLSCTYHDLLSAGSSGHEGDDLCDDPHVLTVFGVEFSFESNWWTEVLPWLVVVAIVWLRLWHWPSGKSKMLTYLIVAEVGYMVGGVWIYNYYRLIGSIFHVISDACMTLCLFLGAGIIEKCRTTHFDGLRGLFACTDYDWFYWVGFR